MKSDYSTAAMKKVFLFLLAVSSCTVYGATLYKASDAVQQSAPVLGAEEHPRPSFDRITNAVKLAIMSSRAPTSDKKLCAGMQLVGGWIMTAAECFDNPEHVYVRLTALDRHVTNKHNLRVEKDDFRHRQRFEIRIHPDYNATSRANNVALIKSSPLFTTDEKSAIYLPYLNDVDSSYENGTTLILTYLSGQEEADGHVMRTNVTLLKHCPQTQFSVQPSSLFCASYVKGKRVSTTDTGAPLIFQESASGPKQVIGIINSVIKAPEDNSLTIEFTRIHRFLNWISLTTGMPFSINKKNF